MTCNAATFLGEVPVARRLTPLADYTDLIPHFRRIIVIGHQPVNAD